ncbi:SAVMC3_10250 family protein [Streptomyces sp. NPDC060334]|uniref:SAVMC3_10250 family protein n=1 Tax=Streptomyces sp. NPDC060334 TaxID=3347099 RepID=UPI0036592777
MSVDGPVLEVEISASSLGTTSVTRAGQVVEALTRLRDPLSTEQAPSRTAVRIHDRGVQELLNALDDEGGGNDMSAMMTGYARITGVLPSTPTTPHCVVASPLIVEYATADSLQGHPRIRVATPWNQSSSG